MHRRLILAQQRFLLGVCVELDRYEADRFALHERRHRPRARGEGFDLDEWTNEEALLDTRFTKGELLQLKRALKVPDLLWTKTNDQFTGIEGLCLLLCRLAYPKRYGDLSRIFRRHKSAISRILGTMIEWLYLNWKRLLEWDPERLTSERLIMFARAIGARTGDEQGLVFGFVDGTSIEVCKPGRNEQCMYGSKGQSHYLRYNIVMLPDGIVAHVSEPAAGTCNDSVILALSCLPAKLNEYAWHPDGRPLKLFGDSAYAASIDIERAQRRPVGVPPWMMFDQSSNGCINVEQAIGHTNQFFGSDTWYKYNRVLNGKVGHFFRLSVLFSNCHTCFRGFNTVSVQYGHLYDDLPLIAPPSLDEYLNPDLFGNPDDE